MEFLGLLVDFGVPAVAAIGSGLVAYALTGGEEEALSEEPNANVNAVTSGEETVDHEDDNGTSHLDADIANTFLQQSADIRVEGSLNKLTEDVERLQSMATSALQKLDTLQQVQPVWATQILTKLDEVSTAIHRLESTALTTGTTAVAGGAATTTVPARLSPLDRHRNSIDLAICAFYHSIPDDAVVDDVPTTVDRWTSDPRYPRRESLPPTTVPACDMMLMFLKNLQRDPTQPRFRRIPANNANYRALLAVALGHRRVMRAIGFELKGNAWEWSWLPPVSDPAVVATDDDERPREKADVMALLTHAIERLQQVRGNSFPLVFDPQRAAAAAPSTVNDGNSGSEDTAASTAPQPRATTTDDDAVKPPVTAPVAPAVVVAQTTATATASGSDNAPAAVKPPGTPAARNDVTLSPTTPSEPPQAPVSAPSVAPAPSAAPASPTPAPTPVVERSDASTNTDAVSPPASPTPTRRSSSASSTGQPASPLSPEIKSMLNKARAISVFSTSRGSLGVSSIATTATAANIFAHDELARRIGLVSPTTSVATTTTSSSDDHHQHHHDQRSLPLRGDDANGSSPIEKLLLFDVDDEGLVSPVAGKK